MARVKAPPFVAKLRRGLKDDLEAAGISAKISSEPIPMTKLYRFMVLAGNFKKMSHSERQDLVWRIAKKSLQPQEELLVSMILTLTPEEASGVEV